MHTRSVRDKYPTNLFVLGVWTLVEAYTIGIITALYQANGAGGIVLQAFIITSTIFIGLTIFTLAISKRVDLSFLGAILFAALLGLFTWGIIIWILGWRQSYLFSLFGAIIFSLLIIYDTNVISRQLGPDDYILGAISLYLGKFCTFYSKGIPWLHYCSHLRIVCSTDSLNTLPFLRYHQPLYICLELARKRGSRVNQSTISYSSIE